MRKILFIIIAALCLSSCSGIDNIEFLNLKRDNPLDGKNNSELTNRIDLKFDNYTVYKDNNNDGIINKGETVELRVCLKNTGSRTANGVKATFSTTSGYVSGFTPTSQVNYADIPANSKKWADFAGVSNASDFYLSYYTIKFTVSNTTPVNTVIPINISITDENSNTWTSSFDVKVESTNAQVSFNTFSVYKDNNNDKIVSKGETVELRVCLKNSGSSAANGVKATFSTTSGYVSGFTPTSQVNYGDIPANGKKWADFAGVSNASDFYLSYYTIKFTVSNSTPVNTVIPINISITDENSNTWTSSFDVKVESTNAQVSFNTFSVYKDNNNDKIVSKGETVELRVSLKNSGSSAANGVKATFSTTSGYVSGFTPTSQVNYADIPASGTKWADYVGSSSTSEFYLYYYTIKFTVSNSTPANTIIPINISITDENSNTWSSSFNVTVQ